MKIAEVGEGKKSGKHWKTKRKCFFLPVLSSSVFIAVCLNQHGHQQKGNWPLQMGSLLPFVSLIRKPCQGVINMKHMTVGGGVGDTSRACLSAGEQHNQFWGAAPVC